MCLYPSRYYLQCHDEYQRSSVRGQRSLYSPLTVRRPSTARQTAGRRRARRGSRNASSCQTHHNSVCSVTGRSSFTPSRLMTLASTSVLPATRSVIEDRIHSTSPLHVCIYSRTSFPPTRRILVCLRLLVCDSAI